jgi:lipoate-protein ligase B
MLLIELPCTEYPKALEIQRRLVEKKILEGGPDVLLVLEHPPTVTIGARGNESDLLVTADALAQRGIGLFRVDRGGEATYHGPGQLVVYPIIDLRRLKLSVRDYVHSLEEAIISCLTAFGLESFRQPGKVGVWAGPMQKIASIGVRIQRRVTSHGFSVNVDVQHDPCELIILCGMPDVRMVSINQLIDPPVDFSEFRTAMVSAFSDVFSVILEPGSLEEALGQGA